MHLADVAQQFAQGNLEYTSSGLNMAVVGEGFFTIRTESGLAYTRAGNFQLDNAGNVVLPQGGNLQVYPPDGIGGFRQTLSNLQIITSQGAPSATTTATLGVNLDAVNAGLAWARENVTAPAPVRVERRDLTAGTSAAPPAFPSLYRF